MHVWQIFFSQISLKMDKKDELVSHALSFEGFSNYTTCTYDIHDHLGFYARESKLENEMDE